MNAADMTEVTLEREDGTYSTSATHEAVVAHGRTTATNELLQPRSS
jgi:hypothetical protein